MKILFLAPYIYDQSLPEFQRNGTGFGIMVKDIFDSVSAKTEAYLLTQVITRGHDCGILKHTWKDVFLSARLKDWIFGIRDFIKYRQSFSMRCRYLYYELNAGTVRKIIKNNHPDVVHIHGLGTQEYPFIRICKEQKVPYVVTLHGLIGLDESIDAPKWDKDLERVFLINADKDGVPVTVISTGMKRRIEEYYLHQESTNIAVVCNGTRIPSDKNISNRERLDLRKEFGIQNEKVAVVIGSICDNKNQMQIIRAMSIGIEENPYHLFLCGLDMTDGRIQQIIDEVNLNGKAHVLGFLSHEELCDVLNQADLNIVASKNEGFGLSIIEAFTHGVPTVSFSDLDAIPDLYNEKAMIIVNRRGDLDLSLGIDAGLKKDWDKTWIREYSKRFSLERVAQSYLHEYEKVLSKRTDDKNNLVY